MTGILLASGSRYRRDLLERLGLPFHSVSPDVDESELHASGRPPREIAALLARAKADAVAGRAPASLVIGSDQVCALDDEVLGKPGSREANVAQLVRLSGRAHRLWTAVCVQRGAQRREFMVEAVLTMRALSPERLARYVAMDQAWDCAGGYKLESGGIALFERIDCADHTAILGLPLMQLARVLEEFGFPVF